MEYLQSCTPLQYELACHSLTRGSTTTDLTTSWAHSIAGAFGLDPSNKLVEYAIRGVWPRPLRWPRAIPANARA